MASIAATLRGAVASRRRTVVILDQDAVLRQNYPRRVRRDVEMNDLRRCCRSTDEDEEDGTS
jgi:hypothetical protein